MNSMSGWSLPTWTWRTSHRSRNRAETSKRPKITVIPTILNLPWVHNALQPGSPLTHFLMTISDQLMLSHFPTFGWSDIFLVQVSITSLIVMMDHCPDIFFDWLGIFSIVLQCDQYQSNNIVDKNRGLPLFIFIETFLKRMYQICYHQCNSAASVCRLASKPSDHILMHISNTSQSVSQLCRQVKKTFSQNYL